MTVRFLALSLALSACHSGDEDHADSMGRIEIFDSSLNRLFSDTTTVETIASGHEWTEGPLWISEYGMLLYSDIPTNTIFKWTPTGGKEVYLKPAGYTGQQERGGELGSNGLILNNQRQLVLCQHGDRRLALMNAPLDKPQASFISLADNYEGRKFDSPNDVVMRSNGDLFFTDPPYGLEQREKDRNKVMPYQGVYKRDVNGNVTLLTDSLTRPNGIGLLPGEKQLLIANSDSEKPVWYLYDLGPGDTLLNGRIFFDATQQSKEAPGLPDGLKITANGIIFATGPGGVWIFDVNARVLGRIRINGLASNCALGEDMLYITADDYVLRVRVNEVIR